MKAFKAIIIFLLSIIQTFIGCFIYAMIFEPPIDNSYQGWIGDPPRLSPFEAPGFIPALIFLLIISAAIMWMKLDELDYMWLFIIFDLVLSPIAFIRTIVAIVLWIKSGDIKLDFDDCDEMENKVICFLFMHEEGFRVSSNPVAVFFTQLFAVFPLSCALTGSAWILLGAIFNPEMSSPLFWFLGIGGILLASSFFVYTKSTEVETGSYKTSNTYVTDVGGGWYEVETFFSTETMYAIPHYTLHYVLTIVFSPIMAFCQALGVVAAFIGIFTDHIYSCYGQMDYRYAPLHVLQYPLGFLCSFIIV